MTNPVAKNISSAKIIGSKYHFPLRKTRVSWRNVRFQVWGRKWARSYTRKQRKCAQTPGSRPKDSGTGIDSHGSMIRSFNKDNVNRLKCVKYVSIHEFTVLPLQLQSTHKSLWKTIGNKLYFGNKQIKEKTSSIHFAFPLLKINS